VLAFLQMEESAITDSDSDVLQKIGSIKTLLTKLHDNLKTARDFKPLGNTKGGAAEVKIAALPAPAIRSDNNPAERLKARVLANPAAHLASMEEKLAANSVDHIGENHPNFPIILKYVIDTLKENGRASEAVPYEQRLAKLMAAKAK